MTAQPLADPVAPTTVRLLGRRLVLALAAIALVGAALAALAWLMAPPAPPPPVRSPFGMGLREAAPAASGLGAWILTLQSQFYRGMQGALSALKQDGHALWPLVGIGFAYGVFHAAGPGHGKAVIAAYLVASERALARGFALSAAAALLQALIAITIVSVLAIALRVTAPTMTRVTHWVEIVSFAAVLLLGLALTWRKSGKLAALLAPRSGAAVRVSDDCGHAHMPPPEVIERLETWRERAGVVVAAGARPCAGAILVLVFALAQGLYPAGIAATFAMAAGTALTTGIIAALAVFAKSLALKVAGGRGAGGEIAVAGLELAAAAAVAAIGGLLLAGYWSGAGGS